MGERADQLILFDIDGTLLDHNHQVPSSAKAAVAALQAAGHTVALATGRSPFMLEQLRLELGLSSYVGFNGQYVVHEGEVIYMNPHATELLRELATFAAERNHPLVHLDAERMSCSQAYHPYVEQCMSSLRVEHPACDPLFYEGRAIFQTMLFCTQEQEEAYRSRFNKLHFVRWHSYSMDVLPAEGSKAAGIQMLMERTGFRQEDTIAFGDNYNDMEMFSYVGCGIAMGNAPEPVKSLAALVTAEAHQDGIWRGLQWAGLI